MKHPNKRYKASTDVIVYEWMVLQNGPSSKETSFHDALHINKDPLFFWATVLGSWCRNFCPQHARSHAHCCWSFVSGWKGISRGCWRNAVRSPLSGQAALRVVGTVSPVAPHRMPAGQPMMTCIHVVLLRSLGR